MKTFQFLCFIALLIGQGLFAQTPTNFLIIHKSNNATDSIPLANVDSITTIEIITPPPPPCAGQTSITYNGYTYQLVEIGSQCWFAENLRTAQYRNGDAIPNVTINSQWISVSTGAWAFYNNNSQNDSLLGKLYNWHTISDSRGICPAGWHVPSDTEWANLTNNLGGSALAGGKMKSMGTLQDGTGLWEYPNTGATNSSGFSGHSGGFRDANTGFFDYIYAYGGWWSSTESSSTFAWILSLDFSFLML